MLKCLNAKMLKCSNIQKGVAVYLAVVVMFLLLGIGIGLGTILIGQIKVFRGMGDSVVAIYAADTGIERELYEKKTGVTKAPGTTYSGSLNVDNDAVEGFTDNNSNGILECPEELNDPDDACYKVTIISDTRIQSLGVYKGVRRAIEISSKVCEATLVDNRDGKEYATVQIGDQCWMKQGLNVGTRIDGSNDQGTDCSSASAINKYCYDDIDANCDTNNNPNYPDGGLYQWDQAMCGSTAAGVQGICPEGWHIPTDAELCILEQEVDPTITCGSTGWRGTDGGTKLKANGSSGFEGNLAGFRKTTPPPPFFSWRGANGYILSSLESSGSFAWIRWLSSVESRVYRDTFSKVSGHSVRCLKD